MKMVGIDGNEANVINRVGSNVYAFELLWAMHRRLETEQKFLVRVYLSSPRQPDMPPETSWWQYRVIGPAKLWTQWRLPLELFLHRDVSFFFSPGHYLPRFSPVPVMASIMDLAFVYFPEQFKAKDAWQLTTLTKRSVAQSAHLIAISEHTKQDIHREYGYPHNQITVAYPAVQKAESLTPNQLKENLNSLGIQNPYICFVGTLQPRKNIERLIEAFELLRQGHSNLQLVLAGKIGWLGEPIQARIDASPVRDHIVQTGFVTDVQKRAILQGARASVLVGLYEGFGIPPLESILLGTVPVVSKTSSLPEVVGEYGVTVDPLSAAKIAGGIAKVLELSQEEKRRLIVHLQRHAQRFSWDESARAVNEAIARELQKNKPPAL